MLNRIFTILECSMVFTLPLTIASWLIVFTFSALHSGNIGYGILVLISMLLIHIAISLSVDFYDYKNLESQEGFDKKEFLKNTSNIRFKFVASGLIRKNELMQLAFIYFSVAFFILIFFYYKCGVGVLYYAGIGILMALTYSVLRKLRISEFVIAFLCAPYAFALVYYVMTGAYSGEVFLLSIPFSLMAISLYYIYSVINFESDINCGNNTIANSFDSQLDSLIILKTVFLLAYTSPLFLCIFDVLDWQIFLTYITIPIAIDVYNSMTEFSINSTSVPSYKWFYFPLKATIRNPEVMIRLYQSRSLIMYFSLFVLVSLCLNFN